MEFKLGNTIQYSIYMLESIHNRQNEDPPQESKSEPKQTGDKPEAPQPQEITAEQRTEMQSSEAAGQQGSRNRAAK